ncbi:MAG TPA: hypothetical protein VLG09_02550 [Candidatus Saccharimonadales bacterium]|nr:hypothetical protein [Candidatus Saccharimonadales bacterium]
MTTVHNGSSEHFAIEQVHVSGGTDNTVTTQEDITHVEVEVSGLAEFTVEIYTDSAGFHVLVDGQHVFLSTPDVEVA